MVKMEKMIDHSQSYLALAGYWQPLVPVKSTGKRVNFLRKKLFDLLVNVKKERKYGSDNGGLLGSVVVTVAVPEKSQVP